MKFSATSSKLLSVQEQSALSNGTSAQFADVLIRGQQREIEQYRWKIKKSELQRDLADAQIALLKESGDSKSNNLHMLVSTGMGSTASVTLPSRFASNDPFGLQTTYSAFVYNSPVFAARRPALTTTRGDYSAVFKPILNREALSYHLDRQAAVSRYRSRSLNRVHSYGYLNPAFRSAGQPPWYLPGSSSSFGTSRFGSKSYYNTFGRSSNYYRSPVSSYYGR